MKFGLAGLIVLVCLAKCWAGDERIVVQIGGQRVQLEIADDPAERNQGLMRRETLAANSGMVFVFPQPDKHCMWMRNTYIPLSVAFLDDQARIINIESMAPYSEASHCATKAARYALEMNLGWFSRNHVGQGTRILAVQKLRAKE